MADTGPSARTAVRVAVLGLGNMGRTHLALLRELSSEQPVVVSAVADVSDAAVARALDGAGAECRGSTDPLALLHEVAVDAVVVASADAAHAELVHACLDRGLPVLCEKPLTTSVPESAEIVERERSLGRRLVQVGFMRRYDVTFAAVADAVRQGAVGAAAVVRTVHRNPLHAYAFEPSVLVRNSASHDVDLVRWTTDDEVVEVGCEQVADTGSDFAAVLLRMRTRAGALAITELAYGPACGYLVGLDVLARNGSLATPMERAEDWSGRFDDAYRRQMRAWTTAVREGVPDPRGATAEDGLAVSRVLAAAEQSWRTGAVITVEATA